MNCFSVFFAAVAVDAVLHRHLEHEPVVFRHEQETMAQLIHQARWWMVDGGSASPC